MNGTADIVRQALAAVRWPPGVAAEIADGRIVVTVEGREHVLAPLVESRVSQSALPVLFGALDKTAEGAGAVLVTPHVGPEVAAACLHAGHMFMDTHGNAHLRLPGCTVHIFGAPGTPPPAPPPARLFRRAGLRIILCLLLDPEAVQSPFRAVAERAGVSLGSVANTFAALRRQGYLSGRGHDRRLAQPANLVIRWATGFVEGLRPRLVEGRYAPPSPDWWYDAELPPDLGLWGGEVAAARLTGYLRPQTVTVYRTGRLAPFLLHYRLRQAPEGSIEVLTPPWGKPPQPRQDGCAPPLLTYADLVAHGDHRCLETAQQLLEDHVLPTYQAT